MKKTIYFLLLFALAAFVFQGCKKNKTSEDPESPWVPIAKPLTNSLSGLGSNPGHPTGTTYILPAKVILIGSIRGGIHGKSFVGDKEKYHGPFPYYNNPKSWVDYGTGTFVHLYMELYNSDTIPTTFTLPGGLIFCDSTDIDDSVGIYQKGYILQNIVITIPALDTAQACVKAYCLNAHLMPSSYDAVYYIGPVTNNASLNQITTIMAPKQPPVGNEYNIQSIVWKVTDQGLTLDTTDINYLNSLP